MIIYRAQEQVSTPAECFREIRGILGRLEKSDYLEHQDVVELLIEYGEFEAAVSDSLSPYEDSDDPILAKLRQAARLVGSIFCASWERRYAEIRPLTLKLLPEIAALESLHLPDRIHKNVPEGYAYYGLYPETYFEAAKSFFRELGPERSVCMGIRSIGTSLSSVVSAALERLGCKVLSFTVRPRGRPFDRTLLLSKELENRLRSIPESYFLVVDEGPGLSGSSFSSVARALSTLGIPDGKIVFFPSWEPDGTGLVSSEASYRWRNHRKFTTTFEDVWVKSGRLMENMPFRELTDISAGRWRSLLYSRESDYPAVNPYHERRKFLCSKESLAHIVDTGGSALSFQKRDGKPAIFMIKFAGLGKYGRGIHHRARRLANFGLCTPVINFTNGFIGMEFVPGRPVNRKDINGDLLDAVTDYLVCLKQNFASVQCTPPGEIAGMVLTNTEEALGGEWRDVLEKRLDPCEKALSIGSAVALDGRMLLHEWIKTPHGFVKTDSSDHQADHFFPGCLDIAWDIAACCHEFGLHGADKEYLVERYKHLTGDHEIDARLPFYSIAYLAFRIGYSALAVETLRPSADGQRFHSLLQYYASILKEEIRQLVQ